MAAIRSIFEYVSDKCYNGLYDAAKKYLDNHWRTMGLETRRVAEIKNAELIDATAQRVYVTDRPGNCIAFDIGLELEVCVSSADHHNDSDDTCYPWLRFSCEGDLSKGLDDWEIREITPYVKRNVPDWFQISALHNMKKRLQTFLRNIIQKPYELQKLENLLFMSTLMF